MRFCDDSNPAPFPQWLIANSGYEWELTTCPKGTVDNDARAFLALFPHYERSLMPYGGGLLEQPQAYLTAMQIIARARTDATRNTNAPDS